eukprot:s49_g45.t1
MVHARKAAKETADAIEYRASLWRAIRRAKGFEGGFSRWWESRPTRFCGLPQEFPTEPPDTSMCEALFHDFQVNYRNYESWHARQRRRLLKVQYEYDCHKIFEITRKEARGGVNYLCKATTVTILSVAEDASQVHVDLDHPIQLPATFQVVDASIPILCQDGPVLTLDGEWLFSAGVEAEIIEHAVSTHQIQERLMQFWKTR